MEEEEEEEEEEVSYFDLGLASLEGSQVVSRLRQPGALSRLTLFSCGLRTLAGLPTAGRVATLRELVLSSNELGPALDAALYPALGDLGLLEVLDLSSNRLRDVLPPRGAPPLVALRKVVLAYNKVASLRGLADLAPSLEALDARSNSIVDVDEIRDLPRLRRLQLRSSSSSAAAKETAGGNPVCRGGRYATHILDRAPSLVELDGDATDDSLRASMAAAPRHNDGRDEEEEEDAVIVLPLLPPEVQKQARRRQRQPGEDEEGSARRMGMLEAEMAALREDLAARQRALEGDYAEAARRLEEERDVALSAAAAQAERAKESAAFAFAAVLSRAVAPLKGWFARWRREAAARTQAAVIARVVADAEGAAEGRHTSATAQHAAAHAEALRHHEAARVAALESAERSRGKVLDLRHRTATALDAADRAAAAAAVDKARLAERLRQGDAALAERIKACEATAAASGAALAAMAAMAADRDLQANAAAVHEAANESARTQLFELRAAFARAAAASADGRAAAVAAKVREEDISANLAEVATLARDQRAAIADLRRQRDEALDRADRAEADLATLSREASTREARRVNREAKTARLEGQLGDLEDHLTAAAGRQIELEKERDSLASGLAAADTAAAAAVADARRYSRVASAATSAAEAARDELSRRERKIAELASALDDAGWSAKLEMDREVRSVAAQRDALNDELGLIRDDVERAETRLKAQLEIERRLRSVISELRRANNDDQDENGLTSPVVDGRRTSAPRRTKEADLRDEVANKDRALRYVEAELLGLTKLFEKKQQDAQQRAALDVARLETQLRVLADQKATADRTLREANALLDDLRAADTEQRGTIAQLAKQRDALAKRTAALEAQAKSEICPY